MAGGFWRGQAAERNLFHQALGEYLSLGGFRNLVGTLTEAQMPFFEDTADRFSHLSASLGNVVPGRGFSGASDEGFRDLIAKFGANISNQALQAYSAPWQSYFSKFGGGVASAYGAGRSQPNFGDFLANVGGQFVGNMLGSAAQPLGMGVGLGMGTMMPNPFGDTFGSMIAGMNSGSPFNTIFGGASGGAGISSGIGLGPF
jgi:hypothetical protein